jgi:hypothetical protein
VTRLGDSDHRHVLDELESLLRETAKTLERFQSTGMDQVLPDDYQKLLVIQAEALREQQVHLSALRDHPSRRH